MATMTDANMDKLLKVFPTTPYFHYYYEMVKHSEACPRFHFFTAAATLGAIISRRVFFQMGSAETFPTIYPNPWIVLVAPQGQGHKSTALGVGERLMQALPEHLRPNMLAAKTTPEALVKALSDVGEKDFALPGGIPTSVLRKSATGILFSSELGVLLGREKYNTGLIALLTAFYDCPDKWDSDTIMRGSHCLYGVCLSIMGASTPEWLQTMLPQDAFKGGFMSRLLLITMPHQWEKRVPIPSPSPPGLRDKIMAEIEEILTVTGRMTFSPEAEVFFNDWYMKFYSRDRLIVSGPVAAYMERRQTHLIRLAMLLQLTMKDKHKLKISVEAMRQAQALFETVDEDSSKIIDFVATEPHMRQAQIILEFLRHHKRLPEDELLKLTWRTLNHPRQFPEMMAMLAKANVIEGEIIGGKMIWSSIE